MKKAWYSLVLAVALMCAGETRKAPVNPNGIAADGFVVWESNRGGAWRLWTERLDGTGLRRLTTDEPRRIHCCPSISPDGKWIAYCSFPESADTYVDTDGIGELRLIRPDGMPGPVIGPARTYGEHRAVVWRSNTEIIYIDGAGYTVLRDVDSGRTQRLTASPAEHQGWLIDPTLTTGTSGSPEFSPYDRTRKTFAPGRHLGGCQPYLSSDGQWGFWTAGGGGPIDRIRLATGEISTIVEKNDPRLPKGLGYLYFPMLSRCGQLFAFAASPDQHDHWQSDYEIFVAEADPRTLELIGPIVRFTNDPSTDRYPDVYMAPLALGRHFVEAPYMMKLDAGAEGDWEWDLGDGTHARGRVVDHTYAEAGHFEVTARLRADIKKGRVAVSSPAAPRVTRADVRGEDEVLISFDETVDLHDARVDLQSSTKVASVGAGPDQRSMLVRVQTNVVGAERARITGVTDRAQRPNVMPPTWIDIARPVWPVDPQSIVAMWESAERSTVRGGGAINFQPSGHAWLDGDFRMVLRNGAFKAPRDVANAVITACRNSNLVSIEMLIQPAADSQSGVIFALSDGRRQRRLTIEQRRGAVLLQIGPDRARIAEIPAARPVHLAIAYTVGVLRAYVDGKPAGTFGEILGGFTRWKDCPLSIGSEEGNDPWQGKIGYLAIYDRVLTAEEVAEEHVRVQRALASVPSNEALMLEAELVARSTVPRLEAISPYRDALVVDEYRVKRVVEGAYARPVVRVVRWAILDGSVVEPPPASRRLRLESFERNRQLQSLYIADTLPQNFELPLYFDIDWPAFPAAD